MMKDELKQLITPLKLNPGASKQVLDELISDLGINLPQDYLEFLIFSNGAEGALGTKDESPYLIIWPAEEVVQANQDYGIGEDYPELVIFGKNAATAAFAFDTRVNPMPIIEADFIDPDYYEKVGDDFVDFLRRLALR